MPNGAIFICIDRCLVPHFGETSKEYFEAVYRLSQITQAGNCGASLQVRLISHREISYLDAIYHFVGEPHGVCLVEGGLVIYNPQKYEAIKLPTITLQQMTSLGRVVSRRLPKILSIYRSLSPCQGMALGCELRKKPGSTLSAKELRKGMRKHLSDLIGKGLIRLTETEDSVGISLPKIHGQAIEYLANQESISLKDSLVIAFSGRDVGFLTKAKFVGCPANADLRCKKFVQHKHGKVSLFPCARGVVDVIEHFAS
jgi:hypothetical protein